MSIKVKNIDPYRLSDKLKESDCELCKEALACIKSYIELQKINQHTLNKAIKKIKELDKRLRDADISV